MIKELGIVKAKCHEVFSYSFTCFPLVYTQVRSGQIECLPASPSSLQIVALTVYSYFLASLLGLQYIESRDRNQDYYFPVFGSLQFVFYVGWLKVAETLINPFGEDDDDFDTNFIVDRNIQFTFLLIDQVSPVWTGVTPWSRI